MEPKRGRPPRISRESIADAVLAVGFENATMRRVAEHLGVSPPGLYHHVGNKDDLLRLAAARALSQTLPPGADSDSWIECLRAWAVYLREGIGRGPEMVEMFTSGTDEDVRAVAVGSALEVLVAEGLQPEQAMSAFDAVVAFALGGALLALRERNMDHTGEPWYVQVLSALANHPSDDLPSLRTVALAEHAPGSEATFDDGLATVLAGIAARYGLETRGTFIDGAPTDV